MTGRLAPKFYYTVCFLTTQFKDVVAVERKSSTSVCPKVICYYLLSVNTFHWFNIHKTPTFNKSVWVFIADLGSQRVKSAILLV